MKSNHSHIRVQKATGEKVPYEREKLITALKFSGISEVELDRIIPFVESHLFDGISTKKLHALAYSQLRKKKAYGEAGRYRLKKGIFDLGPSGYPFEKFIGRVFESFGYEVQTGVLVQGKCIHHEVDVVAKKPGEEIIVEAKFRSDYNGKTTVQVPLYIHSRFNDIKALRKEHGDNTLIKGFVVTNARFTLDAIKYSECVGLGLMSWDYPEGKSLKHFIDRSGLHPLTSLHSISKSDKRKLLDKGIVLCSEIEENKQILFDSGLTQNQVSKILNEVDLMIRP